MSRWDRETGFEEDVLSGIQRYAPGMLLQFVAGDLFLLMFVISSSSTALRMREVDAVTVLHRRKQGREEVDVECWRWKRRERVRLMRLPHICEVDVVAWKERVQRSNRKLIQHV